MEWFEHLKLCWKLSRAKTNLEYARICIEYLNGVSMCKKKCRIYLYETDGGFFYWNYGIKEDWLINSSDFDYINKVTEELNKRNYENMQNKYEELCEGDILDVIVGFANERNLTYEVEFNENRFGKEKEDE